MTQFTIAHMYPDLMNLYGDRGNLACLKKRLEWHGHQCSIKNIGLGDKIDFADTDMLFMGGGSDREQGLVYRDLLGRADNLMEQIRTGLPFLCICGAYQLLGLSYVAWDGSKMNGLGFFKFHTVGKKERLIGNILLDSDVPGFSTSVVGFENHGGRTYLEDSELRPFGKVIKGYGNNGEDKTEGIAFNNLIGTYLHGPLLPKNPDIADWFIQAMATRKNIHLSRELNDDIERFAHQQVVRKIMNR